jgi:hypothetical protein
VFALTVLAQLADRHVVEHFLHNATVRERAVAAVASHANVSVEQ